MSKKVETQGRKKDPEKKEAILKAAESLFLSKGQGHITMDQVAKKAGVSKLTVYNHFGSKKELYEVIVYKTIDNGLSADLYESMSGDNPKEDLFLICRSFLDVAFSEGALNIYRTVLADVRNDSELANVFYTAGLGSVHANLENYFEKMEDLSPYSIPNKREAAETLVGILTGDAFKRAVLKLPLLDRQSDRNVFARDTVESFLKIYETSQQQNDEKRERDQTITVLKSTVLSLKSELEKVEKLLADLS